MLKIVIFSVIHVCGLMYKPMSSAWQRAIFDPTLIVPKPLDLNLMDRKWVYYIIG